VEVPLRFPLLCKSRRWRFLSGSLYFAKVEGGGSTLKGEQYELKVKGLLHLIHSIMIPLSRLKGVVRRTGVCSKSCKIKKTPIKLVF
jgi:hypothetical protein